MFWANGDRYEGDFVDDKRTGRGAFIWANGDRYEGEFIDDHRLHTGRYIFNGRTDEGSEAEILEIEGNKNWHE